MCPRLWGRTKGYRQKRSTLSLHSWTHSRCRLPRQIDSLRVDMRPSHLARHDRHNLLAPPRPILPSALRLCTLRRPRSCLDICHQVHTSRRTRTALSLCRPCGPNGVGICAHIVWTRIGCLRRTRWIGSASNWKMLDKRLGSSIHCPNPSRTGRW